MVVKKQKKELSGVQQLYNFLYEACNIIRGPVSQDNFKEYITPILYFKRISYVYDEETEIALNESDGDKEYAALPEQHRFVIPEGCHWEDIRNRTENLGAAIVGAMREIELANPDTLYGVLTMFSAQKWTDKSILSDERIRNLIEHMSLFKLGNKNYQSDLMGDAYEIMLKKFADLTKAKAGEFYTPRPVIKLLVKILAPKPGETVYDPACGSGGMLIEAIHQMHNDNLCCGSIFGQEKNVVNAAIAKMNLFLHGASDFTIAQGDTLMSPKILQGGELAKFDCVIANPPFSLKNWGASYWRTDKYGRNEWGTPSDKCGDYAWIQHMYKSMNPVTGRMVVVMPQGVLFRQEEKKFRQFLIESGKLDAVITLGEKLFYGTGLSPCILVVKQYLPQRRSGKILFIEGSNKKTIARAQNILSEGNINELYSLYSDYKDVEDFAKIVPIKYVAQNDYELSPNKYVEYHKGKIIPYKTVLANFHAAYKEVLMREKIFRKLMDSQGNGK